MLTFPGVISDIRRRDEDFEPTDAARLGGSSVSSGIFVETPTGKRFIGKTSVIPTEMTEAHINYALTHSEVLACKEIIASDIYAFFGVKAPRLYLSEQNVLNSSVGEEFNGRPSVHLMSELIEGFQVYGATGGESGFSADRPLSADGTLILEDGRVVREKGLGKILAVALWIHDVDVIGGSGANIGFQLDASGEVAESIKIDPGEAFCPLERMRPAPDHHMHVATMGAPLCIDDLPAHTRQEFLFTLETIMRVPESQIRGFFKRRGAERFTEHSTQSADELANLLRVRQIMLQLEYAEDLAANLEAYNAHFGALTDDIGLDAAREMEESAELGSMSLYVPPMVIREPNESEPLSAALPTSEEAPGGEAGSLSRSEAIERRIAGGGEEPEVMREALAAEATMPEALDPPQSVTDLIEDFIESDQHRVLLLKGEAGTGKSLSLKVLEDKLLRARRSDHTALRPIRIELKRFNGENVANCIYETLRFHYHEGDPEAVLSAPTLILADGYDEVGGGTEENIYCAHHLDRYPNTKMIITCRSSYIRSDYRAWFAPFDERGIVTDLARFMEAELQPFNAEQSRTYLHQYVSDHCHRNRETLTDAHIARFQAELDALPESIKALIANPLLLRITLDAMPYLRRALASDAPINQSTLYEAFMQQWFVKQARRLSTRPGLGEGEEVDLITIARTFAESLAFAMHANGAVSANRGDDYYRDLLGSEDVTTQAALDACPLLSSMHAVTFWHKSFQEYLAALYIIHAFAHPGEVVAKVEGRYSITPKSIVADAGTLGYLKALLTEETKAQLFSYIHQSRDEAAMANVAATAITILNAVGQNFSGMDLHGIRIPGADLTSALMHMTNLRGADLAGVTLANAYMVEADFTESHMAGVEFHELPSLSKCNNACYSHSGDFVLAWGEKRVEMLSGEGYTECHQVDYDFKGGGKVKLSSDDAFSVIGEGNTLLVWSTVDKVISKDLSLEEEFKHMATAISSDNTLIAAVFRVRTGESYEYEDMDYYILSHNLHTGASHRHRMSIKAHSATDLVFSSDNSKLFIACWNGSKGKTYVWNVQDLEAEPVILDGHRTLEMSADQSVVLSWRCFGPPDVCYSIELLDPVSLELQRRLHQSSIKPVLSPDGSIIASASEDHLCLHNRHSGRLLKQIHPLRVHPKDGIRCLISPNGEFIACESSSRKDLIVFNLRSGATIANFSSRFDGGLNSSQFHPTASEIITGGFGSTVKRWKLTTMHSLHPAQMQASYDIFKTIISPDGRYVAFMSSASRHSRELIIQLRAASTGRFICTINCTMGIIAFSPHSRYLISLNEYGTSSRSPSRHIVVWSLPDGNIVATKDLSRGWVHSLQALSDDVDFEHSAFEHSVTGILPGSPLRHHTYQWPGSLKIDGIAGRKDDRLKFCVSNRSKFLACTESPPTVRREETRELWVLLRHLGSGSNVINFKIPVDSAFPRCCFSESERYLCVASLTYAPTNDYRKRRAALVFDTTSGELVKILSSGFLKKFVFIYDIKFIPSTNILAVPMGFEKSYIIKIFFYDLDTRTIVREAYFSSFNRIISIGGNLNSEFLANYDLVVSTKGFIQVYQLRGDRYVLKWTANATPSGVDCQLANIRDTRDLAPSVKLLMEEHGAVEVEAVALPRDAELPMDDPELIALIAAARSPESPGSEGADEGAAEGGGGDASASDDAGDSAHPAAATVMFASGGSAEEGSGAESTHPG